MASQRQNRSVSPARLVAAETLQALEADDYAQAADVLQRRADVAALTSEDRGLAHAMVFATLRRALTLDYYVEEFLKRPAAKLQPGTRMILRMAAAQMWILSRLPDYAVVNEMVELGRRLFRWDKYEAGFVNAVLRKLADKKELRPLPEGNRAADLSIRYSFPKEVIGILVKKYGGHKAAALLEACSTEPEISVRVNLLRADLADVTARLTALGYHVQPGRLLPEALNLTGPHGIKPLLNDSLFTDGLVYIQDEASQLVAHVVNPQPGESILDMCSAPGGKTTHMAELARGQAQITATDISEARLARVQENIARLQTPGLGLQPLEQVLESGDLYDAVLVDAPCSGLGTMRRNPEIRYRIHTDKLNEQGARQLEILELASKKVRPGGRIVYSTCSVSDEENEQVIAAFLKKNEIFFQAQSGTKTVSPLLQNGFYVTWPDYQDLDGFEAVVLYREVADAGVADMHHGVL